jgi:hypothetical protein
MRGIGIAEPLDLGVTPRARETGTLRGRGQCVIGRLSGGVAWSRRNGQQNRPNGGQMVCAHEQ